MLALEEILPKLRCPRSGEPLSRTDEGFVSDDSGHFYPTVGSTPILVDFEHSVIEPPSARAQEVASEVARPSYEGALAPLKALLKTNAGVTRKNVAQFAQLLRKRRPEPVVLVIGGGSVGHGADALYDDPAIRIIAFDIYDSDSVQFVADAHAIPLADGSVDGVVIQAVLEHVLEPEQVVSEIWRVLRPGGLVYAETPFLQQVHEGAYDFTRFTMSGHRYLFRRFENVDTGVCGGAGVQLLWSIDYFFRALFRSRRIGKIFKLAFSWILLADRVIPDSYASDTASGSYFLGRKASGAMGPSEIVRFYRGADGG